ncbi:MAG: metallophosphoesterase [bacterium]
MADRTIAQIHAVELPTGLTACYLYPMADLHDGDRALQRAKLKAYLDFIEKTPDTYILLLGDLCNTAIIDSVSDTYDEEYIVDKQKDTIVETFWPVRSRILAMTGGNHEHRISRSVGVDITKEIAGRLGVYYAPDEIYLKVSLGKSSRHAKRVAYGIYATHGTGGGRLMGGKANNLARLAEVCDADIYIAAHTHQIVAFPSLLYRMDLQNNIVVETKKLFVGTGGYLGRSRYAVRKTYPPQKVGSPRIRLDGKRKDAHVSV